MSRDATRGLQISEPPLERSKKAEETKLFAFPFLRHCCCGPRIIAFLSTSDTFHTELALASSSRVLYY